MISKNTIDEFKKIVGSDRVLTDEVNRMTYAYDGAVLDPVLPALVIIPTESEQVGDIIRLCSENSIPVTVRGAGTNLSGGTIPMKDGVVLLTNGLNKILEINEADMYAIVQPGVVKAHAIDARTFVRRAVGEIEATVAMKTFKSLGEKQIHAALR